MEPADKYTNIKIAFVCQPGELEIKSLFLAYSLRKNLKTGFTLVVLIPGIYKTNIDASTILLFGKLGVEIVYFENHYTANKTRLLPGDSMSNKFMGLKSLENPYKMLFLDSDIVCLNTPPDNIFTGELSAKPADFCMKAKWQEIYRIAGVLYPETTVRCTIDNIESPPYFNSGVISIDKNIHQALCSYWEEYFLLFSRKEIADKNLFNPFHRDQLAFALTTEKLGIKVSLLYELFNFPARTRNIIPFDTIFAHYHDCYTIAFRHKLMEQFKQFYKEFPEIKSLLNKHLTWLLLADRKILLLRQAQYASIFKKKLIRFYSKLK